MKNQINNSLAFQKEGIVELDKASQLDVNGGGLVWPIGPILWPLIILTTVL